MALSDFLSVVSPDSSITLSVAPTTRIRTRAKKGQEIDELFGLSDVRYSFDDDVEVFFEFDWSDILEADAATIIDIYLNSSKGAGITKTFIFDHPTDATNYIVRLDTEIGRLIGITSRRSIETVRLKIIGKQS